MKYIFIFFIMLSCCFISCENTHNGGDKQENNETYNDSTQIKNDSTELENDSTKIDEEEREDGDWTDQVGLSQDSVIFNSGEDSIVVATKYTTWWLEGFTFYETSDIRSQKSYYTCTLDEEEKSRTEGVEIKYEWLTVYASSQGKVIKIKVDKNNTGKTRYWSITLQGGDYFGHIYCQQPSL